MRRRSCFAVDYDTDLLEGAVYSEFEAIGECGGMLGVMGTMYPRAKIQVESMYYQYKKDVGSLPLVDANSLMKEQTGKIAAEFVLIH